MVSCVIPTYKRSETLVEAIKSVLSQSYSKIEVIIVDDNEPNDSYSLEVQRNLKCIGDNRVKYIQQTKHKNGAAARNLGIISSVGEFIAFLDDDDLWMPNKIEMQVNFLNDHPEIDGTSTYYTHFLDGKPIRHCPKYNCVDIHKKVLGREVAVFTSTILLRKIAIEQSGYFDESLQRHQDLQLILDFLFCHSLEVIPDYLVNMSMDLSENRVKTSRLIEIKQRFFDVAKRHFDKYDRRLKRDLYAAHYFEIVFSALKTKQFRAAIKYLWKIGPNFKAWDNFIKRVKERRSNMIRTEFEGKNKK